jgi:dihydropteroate synthase
VLVSISEKDFIGETLGLSAPEDRHNGTLAAMTICAWEGVRVFRVHRVAEAVETLKTTAAVRGDLPPERTVRGLA